MAFSGALTITDLDDFLTPSQACIIPVRGPKKQQGMADGPTEIQIDQDNNYYEVSTYPTSTAGPSSGHDRKTALEKAEINLNDCLACSGCITSTESLLITLQSHNEVLAFISSGNSSTPPSSAPRTPVLSISPQTLASLSASYSAATGRPPIPLLTLLRRIRAFLADPSKGGWRVWDTTFARHISLRESILEFKQRREYATRDKGKAVDRALGVPEPGPLPMLASVCPGWVCYAEKAQGDMLPMLSGTRSSQAIIGGLAKTWWGDKMNLNPDQIYHVTAMPCYDKKLEASRSDFYSSMYSTRDVDCVLTTGELDLLLSDLGFDPTISHPTDDSPPPSDISSRFTSPWPELLNHTGSSSGSYLGQLLHTLSLDHPNPTRIISREIRGSTDNVEYFLEDVTTGQILFKGAKCYGFRNLQNLVRKVGKETGMTKSGRGAGGASKLSEAIAARRRKARTGRGPVVTPSTSAPGTPLSPATPTETKGDAHRVDAVQSISRDEKKLDFVEVMACPGGCVNGGGQMKPVSAPTGPSAIKQDGKGLEGVDVEVEVDEEGYPRPMADEGVEIPGQTDKYKEIEGEEGMRWSTKEWVAKVEEIYWICLPTPPPSLTLSPSPANSGKTPIGGEMGVEDRLLQADQWTEKVVWDVCGEDQAIRHVFLRTTFQKVQGDVLSGGSGGISHEAVKW